MLNDCPTCKWRIGQKGSIKLPNGGKIVCCKCTCPAVITNRRTHTADASGKIYHVMIPNYSEVHEYGCAYEPKESKVQTKSNQGLKYCFKCNTPTVKVSTGMFSVYDICPVCKI